MMRTIQLSNSTKVAVVDDDDYTMISRYGWSIHKNGHAHGWRNSPAGKEIWVKMHRLIVGATTGQIVDHINRDKLDNRRSNLRLASKSQNAQNMSCLRPGKGSRFKGVSRIKSNGKWVAQIMHNYKQKHLGCFDSEEAAAIAYNEAAKQEFGDFACLNIVT